MALSDVKICNRALSKIGAKSISSLDAPTGPNEKACALHYEDVRDEILSVDPPWSFAITRKSLDQETNSLGEDYTYKYALPNDCLSPIDFVDAEDADWIREGRYIFTDETSVILRYVKTVTDITVYPKLFVSAMVYRLAAALAPELSRVKGIADDMLQKYEHELLNAIETDARERKTPQQDNTDWEDAGRS